MKVRTRLMIILTIAVIVTLSVWYIDMLNLAKLNKATATIDEVFLPSVENILNADRDLYQVYVAELELFDAVPGSPEWDRYTKEIKDNFQQVVDRVNGYAELATTQEQRNIVAQHVAARDKWKVELDKYIRLLEQGTPEARQQARLIREQVAPLFESTREPLNTLTDASLEMSEKTKNEARDIYSNARKVSLIVIATGMIILLLLIIILLRSITIPLNLAVDHLGLIASGDFTRPVSDNLLRMKDEIGKVARAIDRLQANLRPLLSGLRDDAKTLAGNSEALSASSEEIASSSGEVAKAIQQVAAGAGEQSNHLQEILGLIENITSSLEKVYTELGQVKANSEETSSLAGIGKKELDVLIASIKGVHEAFKVVAERLTSLSGSVNQIGEILEVINGIAEQTNLLALNAAIEAARAGEAGRGFAVVAEEVRKLAEQSSASSDKIKVLLNTIGSETNEVVHTSEEVSKQVVAQLENVENTVKAFDDILESVAAITPMIEATYREVDSTVKAKDVLLDRVQSVSAVSEEASASAEEISASAEELSASTQEIATSAQQVLEVAKRLEQQVARFKV